MDKSYLIRTLKKKRDVAKGQVKGFPGKEDAWLKPRGARSARAKATLPPLRVGLLGCRAASSVSPGTVPALATALPQNPAQHTTRKTSRYLLHIQSSVTTSKRRPLEMCPQAVSAASVIILIRC